MQEDHSLTDIEVLAVLDRETIDAMDPDQRLTLHAFLDARGTSIHDHHQQDQGYPAAADGGSATGWGVIRAGTAPVGGSAGRRAQMAAQEVGSTLAAAALGRRVGCRRLQAVPPVVWLPNSNTLPGGWVPALAVTLGVALLAAGRATSSWRSQC